MTADRLLTIGMLVFFGLPMALAMFALLAAAYFEGKRR